MQPTPIGITARIAGPLRWVAGAPALPLHLPEASSPPDDPCPGRYFLARCAEAWEGERVEWSLCLRRPLYAVQRQGSEWLLHLPPDEDPGHAWLRRRGDGASLHLLGPFGNGFALPEAGRNLLVVADLTDDPGWLALLVGLLEPALDRGARVALLLRSDGPLDEAAIPHLPIAVEVQTAPDEEVWRAALARALPWADQVAAGLPASRYAELAQAIRSARFRLEEGFCQVLVRADLLCGVGACLACVVHTGGGGITRACVHGPVFDLARLTGS